MSRCPYDKQCGGCTELTVPYEEQLAVKKTRIESLFPGETVEDVLGMQEPYHYRHKVQAAFRFSRGKVLSGTYGEGSHQLVNVDACLLDDPVCDKIILDIRHLAEKFHLSIYNEKTGQGVLRHVLIRKGFATGEILVVLVTGSYEFPGKQNFQKELRRLHPEITTIVQNINGKFGSMVLGEKTIPIYGSGTIYDVILGKSFRISANSFYQVNPLQTEILYKTALSMVDLTGETVLDAYSGTGTIGILAAERAVSVTGVELNPAAVKDAVNNAKRNQLTNIQFICQDAGKYLLDHEVPDVVILDPPRSGSSPEFLNAVGSAKPKSVIYISCNPETQARDIQMLKPFGYHIKKIQPVDMFPQTSHCENICLLIHA